MKYHINFGSEYRLSFEMLDNPIADAWVSIMQEKLKDEESSARVFRSMFGGFGDEYAKVHHFNNLLYYVDEAEKHGLDLEFTIDRRIENYTDSDFNTLLTNIDLLFRKVVVHNFYFNESEETNYFYKRYTRFLKRFAEELMDAVFHSDESYARIKQSNEGGSDIEITDEMRKQCFVETERPKIVLKACPNFDLKSLNILEQRNNPTAYAEDGSTHMHFVTSEHKVSLYKEEQTQSQAKLLSKVRRNKMLNFVLNNNLDTNAGYLYHTNYALPIIGHCINEQDFSTKDLQKMFLTIEHVTAEFEE